MRPTITIFIFVVLQTLSVTGQKTGDNKNPLPYFITSRNIDFVIEDTVIPISLLTKPNGQIDWKYGHNYVKTDYSIYRFRGSRRNQKVYYDTIVKSPKNTLVLDSYFPPLNQDSSKFIYDYNNNLGWVAYNDYKFSLGKDSVFIWGPHYGYEFYYSYILAGINADMIYKSKNDSIVRIIISDSGTKKEFHEIFELNLSSTKINLIYISTQHNSEGVYNITDTNSCSITKPKQLEMFYEEFKKFEFSDSTYFIKADGSENYLIEFKDGDNYYALLRPYIDCKRNLPKNKFPIVIQNLYDRNKKNK